MPGSYCLKMMCLLSLNPVLFPYVSVLVRVSSIGVIKSNLGKKEGCFRLQLSGHTEISQDKNPRQEPGGRTEAETMAASHGFLSLLAYPTQDHLARGCTTYPQWTGSLKKMPHRFDNDHFLNWGSLFPNDSSLGQVDHILTRTVSYSPGFKHAFMKKKGQKKPRASRTSFSH